MHRLDRPVSGLMVFARTSKAAARLSAQFQTHAANRQYLCVCEGEVPQTFTLTDWLLKDKRLNQVSAVPEGTPGAQKAVLHAERVAAADGLSLCAVRLETGRSHQIRAQFAATGYPLWGDNRYGHGCPGQTVALFGYRLTFTHPVRQQEMVFTAAPDGGIWERFSILKPVCKRDTTDPEHRR